MGVKKILILAANPHGTQTLGLGREIRQIEAAIRLSEGRERFKIKTCLAVGPDEMRRALLERPEIVHFSGHGAGASGLALETQQGQAHLVNTKALAQILKLCGSVECVLLNACYSKVQAQAIAKSVGCVIGMNQTIQDDSAQEFAKGFYDGLGHGYSYEKAFEWGKSAIATANLSGAEVLCLVTGELSDQPVVAESPDPSPALTTDDDTPNIPATRFVEPTSSPRAPRLKWSRYFITAAAATAGVMSLRFVGGLQALELPVYDWLMSARPALFDNGGLDPRILFIEVDDEFVATDKRYSYPLKDSLLVEAIKTLSDMNPRAIGLDMHRAQNNSDNDPEIRQAFISQFEDNPNLITVCSFSSEDQLFQNPAELSTEQVAYQVGFSDLELDALWNSQHGTVRRQLLSYQPGKTACQASYSFSFQLAYAYLAESEVSSIDQTKTGWRFGDTSLNSPPYRAAGHSFLQAQSDQILINYRAKKRPARSVSLKMLLDGKVDPSKVENKIILIGATTTFGAMQDNFRTPHGDIPGVWVHGHVISQMLSTAINDRPQIWFLPQWSIVPWGDILWTFMWGTSSGLLIIRLRQYRYWIIGGIASTLTLIGFIALVKGAWLPVIPPLLVTAIASGTYLKILNKEQNHENQDLQAQVSDRVPVSSRL